MSPEAIERVFAHLSYEEDDRAPPDERRRAQFRDGWEDVTKRGEVFSETTLKRVTWYNLGYRFGLEVGDSTPAQIDAVYDRLVDFWDRLWSEGDESAAPSVEQYASAFRSIGSFIDLRSHVWLNKACPGLFSR